MDTDDRSPAETLEIQPVQPAVAEQAHPQLDAEVQRQQRQILIGAIVAGVVVLAILIGAVYLLLQPTTDTAKIRDVFIIVMAVESLIIGVSLIILLFQLARLINLLQNEIKPIVDSTQETVNTLRGTTIFLSDNLVEPVVKMNEYLAAMRSFLGVLRITRKK